MAIAFSETQLLAWTGDLLWPLIRVSAVLAAAPVFNYRQVPLRFRAILALALTGFLVPLLPPMPDARVDQPNAFLIVAQQVAIGLTIGFMLQMAFQVLIFGGQVMAYSMGLGFATMVDPANGVQVPVLSQFLLVMAALVFLITNGHLLLIEVLLESFRLLPVGAQGLTLNDLWQVLLWAGKIFSVGVVIALPVLTALLLMNIGLGVIARAAPQLNIFAVGFPVTLMSGFLLVWASLPTLLHAFENILQDAFTFTLKLLG